MKHFATLLFFINAIQGFCQGNVDYLGNLPSSFSLYDVDDELGQQCTKDFDKDGKSDLIIELFSLDKNSDSPSIIAIFLSSKFETDNSYQWFNWIWSGNALSLDCEEKIEISGGMESQGIYQSLELVYSQSERKIIVKSYEDSSGETVFEINTNKFDIVSDTDQSLPKVSFETKVLKQNNLQEGTHGDNSETELIFSIDGKLIDSFEEFGQVDIENDENGNPSAYFASDLSQVTISSEIIDENKIVLSKTLIFDLEERSIWTRTYSRSNGTWKMSSCEGECD